MCMALTSTRPSLTPLSRRQVFHLRCDVDERSPAGNLKPQFFAKGLHPPIVAAGRTFDCLRIVRYAVRVAMKAFLIVTALAAALHGQVIRTVPWHLVRLDPALDSIVAPDSPLEVLGEHFGLTEGPLWVKDASGGYLLFSDCAANVIYKWQPDAPLSVFLERSGFTGCEQPERRSADHSGKARDSADRLQRPGSRSAGASHHHGDGRPDSGAPRKGWLAHYSRRSLRWQAFQRPQRDLTYNGFYLVKNGKVTLLGGDRDRPGGFPNGIALSPDEKTLYVTAGFHWTLAYDVLTDDTVANPRVFLEAGNDGMKTDNRGNVFQVNAVGQGEVLITAPNGKRLGTIQLPQIGGEPRPRICASNVAFGDADGKGLYITACTHLFRLRLRASGLRAAR